MEVYCMKLYLVEFRVKAPGIYQNVIGSPIEADSPTEALALAAQWLIDNGMSEEEALKLSSFNKIREVGDNCTIYTLWR